MYYLCHAIVLILCGIFVSSIGADHIIEAGSESSQLFCKNVRSQHSLNIQEILGEWYGSEIITHTEKSPGTYYYDTCAVIHLTDITQEMSQITTQMTYKKSSHLRHEPPNQYLRLSWDEKNKNLEYTLNYSEENPGLWMSVGDQSGSMLDLQYQQFRGTIQVTKAVHDHIVLTFCDFDATNSTFFTIVLTRRRQGLGEDSLKSIRGLLSRRGLATDSIRKVCTSSASSIISSFILTIVLSLILYLRSK